MKEGAASVTQRPLPISKSHITSPSSKAVDFFALNEDNFDMLCIVEHDIKKLLEAGGFQALHMARTSD